MLPRPRLSLLAPLAVLLSTAAAPAAAQQAPGSRRPALLLAGGVAGQRDDDRDLGPPGVSAAVGLAWGSGRAVGLRLEAQAAGYPGQARPLVAGARGSAERVGALAVTGVWRPGTGRAALYVLSGPAAVRACESGAACGRTQLAGILGVGAPVAGRFGLEAQYLHLPTTVGRTRAVLSARALLRL